jgi:hypothetical protein
MKKMLYKKEGERQKLGVDTYEGDISHTVLLLLFPRKKKEKAPCIHTNRIKLIIRLLFSTTEALHTAQRMFAHTVN